MRATLQSGSRGSLSQWGSGIHRVTFSLWIRRANWLVSTDTSRPCHGVVEAVVIFSGSGAAVVSVPVSLCFSSSSQRGKTYLPKNGFGPPPPIIRFPPLPFVHAMCHFLWRKRDRPDKSHRPPKVVLEGALYSTFSPGPQNRTIRFPPPLCDLV